VGVNAGHVPTYPGGHSGISHFYKSIVIREILDQHGLNSTATAHHIDSDSAADA
jgi:hypothetical protein